MRRAALVLLPLTALAACTTPAVVPQPAPPPPPVRQAPPVPQPLDWQDWPMTAGDWTYARNGTSTIARFGMGGMTRAWLRCDLASHVIALGREGAAQGGMMTIRTTFAVLQWPVRPAAAGLSGAEAVRGASDPGLDQIAFSRGRFTLELAGAPPLVVPSWAEPARVIEDCRG